jgi:processive 1,2-diacylglycerol beta-glucosyltransferase
VAFVVFPRGSRDDVRSALAARFAGSPGVRVLGFTDRMPDVLAAAEVLIHSTAGLTVMEALVTGCAVISYGWGRGHIRANNAAFAEHGMARVARDRGELRVALAAALAAGAEPDRAFRALPTAAQVVLERFAQV